MKYFSDEQINQMKQRVKTDFDATSGAVYMVYLDKIEQLNKQYADGIDCKDELLQVMAEFEHFSEQKNFIL